jgi:tetratricopeptide (TPR) repeat protein
VALLAAFAAGVAWLVAFLRSHGLDWAARFSEIASFALAGLALLLPAAGRIWLWLPAPRIKDEQVESDVTDLAAALRAQGRISAALPGVSVYDRMPMPVRWQPVGQTKFGKDLDGTFDEVLEYFKRLPEPRLVVLGVAGAGKTVLAAELARRLLASRRPHDSVPIIIPVAAWDPARTTLFNWIATQITRINPELRQRVSDGRQTTTRAHVLVDRMKILPILDGLDELTRESRPIATLAVNRYGWSQPLVVTCRDIDYLEIIGKQHGTPVARAAVVELTPLSVDAIKGYLGPDLDGQWTALYARLDADPAGAMARALANPLMLWLVWAIYGRAGQAPDELADARRFGSHEAIESHLLEEFAPTLYLDATAGSSRLRSRQTAGRNTRRWLGFLAEEGRNVAWWRLSVAANGLRFFGVFIRAALLWAVLWHQIIRVLTESGSWRNGSYTGHLPFRAVFLQGPLGQLIWPTVDRLLQQVSAPTRNNTFVTLNHALRWALEFPSRYSFFAVTGAIVAIAFYTSAGGKGGPRRVLVRPGVLTKWLINVCLNVLAIILVALAVMLNWHHASGVSAFFDSRATWIAVPLLALAMALPTWPRQLVSDVDVVGATTPLQSLQEDRRACIIVTTLRHVLLAVTIALICGYQLALAYVVFAVASAAVTFTLGGVRGFASAAYADARIWLAIAGRLPWRPMPFLIDAERRGVFQEIGAMYRFRHARVREELAAWYTLNRFRPEDWRQYLQRLLDAMGSFPELDRVEIRAGSYRHLARQNPAEFGPDLISALGDLADLLRARGRRAEELTARSEIVTIVRAMAEPKATALTLLAGPLERLARCLAESGREYEALGVMSEAAEIYGYSASAERSAFVSRLGDWLQLFPYDVGRRTRTRGLIDAVDSVVDIYRDMVLTEPETSTAAHAIALLEMAKVFRKHRRNVEAAGAIKSAALVYRQLMRAESGAAAVPHAEALIDTARMLGAVRLPDEAVAALTDALPVYRELAQADPGAYLARLATLLGLLVKLLRTTDRAKELAAIREAVGIYDAAAGSEPVSLPLTDLSDMALRLWQLGEREAAIHAAKTGRDLMSAGAPGMPASARPMSWSPPTERDRPPRHSRLPSGWGDFADKFDTYAFRLLASGEAKESLAASIDAVRCGREQVKVDRDLSGANPSAFLEALAGSLDNLAAYLQRLDSGDEEAAASAAESAEIRRRLGLSQEATASQSIA